MGATKSRPSAPPPVKTEIEPERREQEMDRREREPDKEPDKEVRYELPAKVRAAAAAVAAGAVDRPGRSTEHVMLPQKETQQQMKEQLKAEYHPEFDAPEMPTEVLNPVRRDSKEFPPPNMPESEPKPPATP